MRSLPRLDPKLLKFSGETLLSVKYRPAGLSALMRQQVIYDLWLSSRQQWLKALGQLSHGNLFPLPQDH